MPRAYPARTVLAQRIRERRLTLEEFSERLEVFARENNEVGTVSLRHAQRLAAGEWTADQLRPATTRLLENFFESPIDELLVSPETKVLDKNEPEISVVNPIGESHIRHPVDGRLMAKIDGSVFLSGRKQSGVVR
ncbi:MAG: hypothetical protein LC775_19715 [Acidobacteria bacterium]|nr:hypothetical protein [Acidobacteriota bacterium]